MSWQTKRAMLWLILCELGFSATGLARPAASPSAVHAPADARTAMPSDGFDDPFFTDNADPSAAPIDTRWQDDQVIEKQATRFVGPTPPLSQLRELWQHDVLSLGLSAQVSFRAQEQPAGDDGFALAHLRPRLYGQLGNHLSYFFEVDLAQGTQLLDASITLQALPELRLRLGQLRLPLAAEYLQKREDLLLLERSETVQALAAQRRPGVQLEGDIAGDLLRYRVTVQSDQGYRDLDWGRRLRGSARVDLTPIHMSTRSQKLRLDLGAALSYAPDLKMQLEHPLLAYGTAAFTGRQLAASGHARLQIGPAWLESELLWSRLDSNESGSQTDVLGGYGELGAALARERVELLLRVDASYHSLRGSLSPFIIAAARVYVLDALRLQVSYAWGPFYDRSASWSPNQVRAGLWLVF